MLFCAIKKVGIAELFAMYFDSYRKFKYHSD